MANKRVSKEITNKEDLEMLLNIKESDITTSFVAELFGEFDGKVKFHQYDIMTVPIGVYGKGNKKNKNAFTTTVGLWVFNKYCVEPRLFDVLHYVNKSITKKVNNMINEELSYSILEDKITIEDLKDYIMKCQKIMPYVTFLSPSQSTDMLLVTEKLNKRKAELLKKHSKEIEAKDLVVLDRIQKELLEYARELLKDDPAMDMFNSGARGSFDNNFKNMFVMRGAVKDPDPNKGYNIITSNYIDGVSKEEYSALANSLAAGPYARAKKTEVGGYWEKLFLSAYQHIHLDPAGSDCGTKRTITVKLDKDNIKELMYCYIQQGDRLIEITSENRDKYIGKTVKLRFASLCESKTGICNKCAGNLFYKLGITNIGVAMPQLASRLKVLQLKLFHDDQVSFAEMDPMKAFGLE